MAEKKEYNVRYLSKRDYGGGKWMSCFDNQKFRTARFTLDEARKEAIDLLIKGLAVRIYKGNTMVEEFSEVTA